ncbi:hypothetical protein [uncultured Variovorax sp.]|uniref:hypothetical protein n=1 Tax=uncultured Variovorax sp. TaxID=114708 RepID=UPI00261CEB72|nr:hypothetical protein [uncultured Variovorax sp.]
MATFVTRMAIHGWYGDRVRADVASKDFETAAGGRTAVVYCRQSREGPHHLLSGDYQSEGRNALSTCWGSIPADADQAAIEAAVDRFARQADSVIRETYAMRLMALLAEPLDDPEPVEQPSQAPG